MSAHPFPPSPFDFKSGIIKWNNYHYVAGSYVGVDRYDLAEDMILVRYDLDFSLDIGWYGGTNGHYGLHCIKSGNWERPMLHLQASSFVELKAAIEQAVKFIED